MKRLPAVPLHVKVEGRRRHQVGGDEGGLGGQDGVLGLLRRETADDRVEQITGFGGLVAERHKGKKINFLECFSKYRENGFMSLAFFCP